MKFIESVPWVLGFYYSILRRGTVSQYSIEGTAVPKYRLKDARN